MSAKKASKVFQVNDKVFAKVRGYPAWPARIESGGTGGKYNVFFYGTYETASVKKADIWPYNEDTKKRYGKANKKMFPEAMREIEDNPDIRTREQLSEMDRVAAEQVGLEQPPEIKPEGEEEEEGGQQQQEQGQQPKEAAEAAAESVAAVPEAAAAAVADVPVVEKEEEDDGEENKLTIDESASSKKVRRRSGNKRKANEDSPMTSAPPPAKRMAAAAATPTTPQSTPDTPASATVSRSGRVIKPKKFGDEKMDSDEANHHHATPETPKTR